MSISIGTDTSVQLISYEAIGCGNLEFGTNIQDMVYPKPTLESGEVSWPITSGYSGYIAQGTGVYPEYGDDVDHDAGVLTGVAINGNGAFSVNTQSQYTFESERSIRVVAPSPPTGLDGTYSSGGIIWTNGPGLAWAATTIRISADLWLDSMEEFAIITARARIYYTDGHRSRTFVDYRTLRSWQHFEWSIAVESGRTIDKIDVSFYDSKQDLRHSHHENSIFYVDNINLKKLDAARYIYFGNAIVSDLEQLLSIEDAERALYAYSGMHNLEVDSLIDTNVDANSLRKYNDRAYQSPLVVDFDVTSDTASVYPLAIDENNLPIRIEAASGFITCRAKLKSTGNDVVVRNILSSAKGHLRVAVTTLTSEGESYTQDANLVKDWLVVIVSLNARVVLTAAFPIYGETTLGSQLCYGSATMHTSRVRVSVAKRLADVFSIDPGEAASSALGRLIGTSNLIVVAQPNRG